MKQNIIRLFPCLILLITFTSANQWAKYPIGNTNFIFFLNICTIICIFYYRKTCFQPDNYKDYRLITVYLIWLFICATRGAFIADNYWEWKQLFIGIFSSILPIFVWPFSSKELMAKVIRFWIRYALIAFFLFFIWSVGISSFYLAPILFVTCFAPLINNKKWRYFIILFTLVMTVSNLGFRSQVIKGTMTLLICSAVFFHRLWNDKIIRLAHIAMYLLPIILLILGISGTFNIFQDLNKNEGRFVEQRIVDGQLVEEDLSADTRTFIYEEVITSAIRHNYVFFGRTPARGNDSMAFGAFSAEELKTGRYERHGNELCHLNIFTWLGLVGMILYSCIYFRSSYLAVYKSNNIYIKLLGVFIAFRWAYGWIEDFNKFDIMNTSLWMMISMGFSEQFRSMNNLEFKQWVNSIFNKKQK